jgi:hypothetical protein
VIYRAAVPTPETPCARPDVPSAFILKHSGDVMTGEHKFHFIPDIFHVTNCGNAAGDFASVIIFRTKRQTEK